MLKYATLHHLQHLRFFQVLQMHQNGECNTAPLATPPFREMLQVVVQCLQILKKFKNTQFATLEYL